jgi:hypothetical protein
MLPRGNTEFNPQSFLGEGVRKSDRPQDVLYNEPEAILPDENLNNWVVDTIKESMSVGRLATLDAGA